MAPDIFRFKSLNNKEKYMLAPIVEIFCDIDDFCKKYINGQLSKALPSAQNIRYRQSMMSISEIITILILFHVSHYRTFKDYYRECILLNSHNYFPNAVSYNRFVEIEKNVLPYLTAYLLSKMGNKTNYYYIDSSKLAVCHNKRIFNHTVFKGIANRGKTSMGWFFGLKLHIVINHKGEIVNFCITKGNIDDRNVLLRLFSRLRGLAAGDKGYISGDKANILEAQGLKFITKIKSNMKKRMLTVFEKFFLAQRCIVETVIGQLKALCHIEHTRHRNPDNFVMNLISGLAAYCISPKKPSINLSKFQHKFNAVIPS